MARSDRWPAQDDTEAIVYGSIDLDSIIRQKIHHDVAGNYNRFDVLSLALNLLAAPYSPSLSFRSLRTGAPHRALDTNSPINGPGTISIRSSLTQSSSRTETMTPSPSGTHRRSTAYDVTLLSL